MYSGWMAALLDFILSESIPIIMFDENTSEKLLLLKMPKIKYQQLIKYKNLFYKF